MERDDLNCLFVLSLLLFLSFPRALKLTCFSLLSLLIHYRCVFGLPFEAVQVTKEILDEQMPPEEYIEGWIEGREDLEWPPGPELAEGEGPPEGVELRFGVDARVEFCIGVGEDGWAAGTIVALWYRHPTWGPKDYAPYQIQLDDHDGLIFAPQDSDVCIRLLQDGGMSDRSTPAEAK